jgi:hypothetical protein
VSAFSRLVQQQNVLCEQDCLSPPVAPVEGEVQDIPLEGGELDDPLSRERSITGTCTPPKGHGVFEPDSVQYETCDQGSDECSFSYTAEDGH